MAAAFLADRGFEIVEQNYFAGRRGELDIIALKEKLLLFVEVKTRSTGHGDYGGALRSVDNKKIHALKRSADHFLVKHPGYYTKEYTYRFDLISIEDGEIQWVQDIVR